jgi:hypothetical protein
MDLPAAGSEATIIYYGSPRTPVPPGHQRPAELNLDQPIESRRDSNGDRPDVRLDEDHLGNQGAWSSARPVEASTKAIAALQSG